MSVIKRTWPYGTRKAVKVIQAGPGVMTVAELAGKEAYVLVNHGVRPVPPMQARGIIEFTEGGRMGGYWQWLSRN
jgi:hypothetical protein